MPDFDAMKTPAMRAAEERLGIPDLRAWLLEQREEPGNPTNLLGLVAERAGVKPTTVFAWMKHLHLGFQITTEVVDEVEGTP